MSGGGNRSRLVASVKDLAREWEETKGYWRDAKCEEFDRHYMQELLGRVERAAMVMEKLDELLTKVRKDCE
jgi:hypothetical protein